MKNLIVFLFIFLSSLSGLSAHSDDRTHYANPFVGTDFTGNTYPGAQMPFGMVQLSPDNLIGGWDRIAGYFYPDSTITGFSHTHLDGTGAGDMYDISFMPVTLPWKCDTKSEGERLPLGIYSTFSHEEEGATPGYYTVRLADYDINVTLTATPRCGIQHYVFPNNGKERVVILNLDRTMNWDRTTDCDLQQVDATNYRGYRFSDGWARNQRVYFATRFSQKPLKVEVDTLQKEDGGKGIIARFYFSTAPEDNELTVCTALSGTSIHGATRNLEAEAPTDDFALYVQQARTEWNLHLGVIETAETAQEGSAASMDAKEYETRTRKFYTALYHSMLAPTIYSDIDGSYLGPDGRIHRTEGVHYSTFSLWDTFRAAHPLLTLTNPDRVADMANSLIDFGVQNGRLPVWNMWASETDMMIGYHAVPVIVDAILKGFSGIDPQKALDICVQTARKRDYRSIGTYIDTGYVPTGTDDMGGNDDWSMSRTLEYAYDDWCIAQLAAFVGAEEVAREFYARSKNYENLFNTETGFLEPRNADGSFIANFSPVAYGPHVCESNAWMYQWSVQHDVKGLCNLMGGKKKMTAKLDEFFTFTEEDASSRPLFSTGMIGQYAHGNEPSHHVAYLYNFVRQPAKCQRYVAQICRELYHDEPAGLCGNEDCGQTSAWFVMSAMGFYPVNPVGGIYEIGTPLLPRLTLHLENGQAFHIVAHGVDQTHFYVKNVKLNGKKYPYSTISDDVIQQGGTLELEMSATPCEPWY